MYPKEMKMWPQRDLSVNLPNNFIYDSLKQETAQKFINRKWNKHIVMQSHPGILLSHKKGTSQWHMKKHAHIL